MMPFEIIDDFVPSKSQDYIQRMLEYREFPWMLIDAVEYPKREMLFNPRLPQRKMFQHMFSYGDGYLEKIIEHIPLPEFKTHKLVRAKANLNWRRRKRYSLAPHADSLNSETISYFYYANNSDGPTVLYPNYFCSSSIPPNSIPSFWEKKVKIYPKKGRMVKIPANLLHSDNVPDKYETRLVLNFVFEI